MFNFHQVIKWRQSPIGKVNILDWFLSGNTFLILNCGVLPPLGNLDNCTKLNVPLSVSTSSLIQCCGDILERILQYWMKFCLIYTGKEENYHSWIYNSRYALFNIADNDSQGARNGIPIKACDIARLLSTATKNYRYKSIKLLKMIRRRRRLFDKMG